MKKTQPIDRLQSRCIPALFLVFLLFSCSKRRTKAAGEILLSEVVYEEQGVYYKLSTPDTKLTYSGACEFFLFQWSTQRRSER